MKIEVAVRNSDCGLCRRKATFEEGTGMLLEQLSCPVFAVYQPAPCLHLPGLP